VILWIFKFPGKFVYQTKWTRSNLKNSYWVKQVKGINECKLFYFSFKVRILIKETVRSVVTGVNCI